MLKLTSPCDSDICNNSDVYKNTAVVLKNSKNISTVIFIYQEILISLWDVNENI